MSGAMGGIGYACTLRATRSSARRNARIAGHCAIVLLVTASLAGCPRAPRTPEFVAKACEASLASTDAVCGSVTVPENYTVPEGRRIALNVVVFRARQAPMEPAAQFDLEGGPGFAVSESASFYAGEGAAYRQRRDVVLFDMRGTGGSNGVVMTY